jgi:hypothetical protein
MPSPPRLVPVPPTSGEPAMVDRSPFWIGSAASAALRIYLPGIAERHASITEREDGYYLSPFPGAGTFRLDGRPIGGPTKLEDAQVLDLGPTAKWEFVTGAPRQKPAEPEPEPDYQPAPGRRKPWRWRRRGSRAVGFPVWAIATILLLLGAVGYGGYLLYHTIKAGREVEAPPPSLTEFEGRMYDSLMTQAQAAIERGNQLLDLGLREQALGQFALGIGVFDGTLLANNPWVKPNIEALIASVQRIYREKSVAIPAGLRAITGKIADLSKSLAARLTSDQFETAVAQVGAAFRTRFHRDFAITGRDHAEHLSLYGARGAMDIRTKDLAADQVVFLRDTFKSLGIRVKDFSLDQILQSQIAAAIAAGRKDLAGTGLHLHVDRFRDRRDRWTV